MSQLGILARRFAQAPDEVAATIQRACDSALRQHRGTDLEAADSHLSQLPPTPSTLDEDTIGPVPGGEVQPTGNAEAIDIPRLTKQPNGTPKLNWADDTGSTTPSPPSFGDLPVPATTDHRPRTRPLFIDVEVEGRTHRALVDPGAPRSKVHPNVAHSVSFAESAEGHTITTFDGGSSVEARRRVVTRIVFDTNEQDCALDPLIITEGLRLDIVLGLDWLRRHKVLILDGGRAMKRKKGRRLIPLKPPPPDLLPHEAHALHHLLAPVRHRRLPNRLRIGSEEPLPLPPRERPLVYGRRNLHLARPWEYVELSDTRHTREVVGLLREMVAEANDERRARWKTDAILIQHGVLWFRNGLYVPSRDANSDYRLDCIEWAHQGKGEDHPDHHRTLEIVQEQFDWPTVQSDVWHFVRSCYECQRRAPPALDYPALFRPLSIPSRPWESVALYRVDAFTESQGSQSIFVLEERFSNYIWLFRVRGDGVGDALKKYGRRIASGLPPPREIISDEVYGLHDKDWPDFPGRESVSVLEMTGRPEPTRVEMKSRLAVRRLLGEMSALRPGCWAHEVPLYEHAYLSVPIAGEGATPYDRLIALSRLPHADPGLVEAQRSRRETLFAHRPALADARSHAKGILKEVHRQVVHETRNLPRFNDGADPDSVLISTRFSVPTDPALYPARHWMGPATILERMSVCSYRVQLGHDPPRGRLVHASLLRPCHQGGSVFRVQAPGTAWRTCELSYELEEVLGEHPWNGMLRVKWKGIPGETWTRAEGLEGTVAYQAFRQKEDSVRRPRATCA